ncbi:Meiotic recombination protein DMC1 -like protein [Capsicum annuum]|nr:Meiotic recombination protein DMC1 -like protein [Capsicum annuum]
MDDSRYSSTLDIFTKCLFRPEEQLQLVEREEIDDEEDLFEAIDKHLALIWFAVSCVLENDILISPEKSTSTLFSFKIHLVISHGINAGDVKKLQDAGIYTCNGLMMHTKKNLTGIKGLSEAKVEKICEAAEKIRKAVVKITTGSQALDELLGGGIETSAITEAFGEFRSGKTQLAHTLCVSTQLPTSMKGGNGKVAYIDTEGTFRPDRVVPIAERFGMDAGAVLDNIIYARAYTYEHQYNLLLGLAAKMAEEPFRLLIVDSVIALFRVDFTGRGELADRQQKLAQMLSRLIKIAEEFNVAVYMTNQVIADPGGGVFISDPKKPAGGHVLAHAATIRLMFRKGKGEQRVCKVFDAPNLPESEAISFSYYISFSITDSSVVESSLTKEHIFQITAGGIADAKD